MKRIAEFKILSHDHHTGLVFARRMKQIAMNEDFPSIQKAWMEIASYYKTELEPHFYIEETFIAQSLKELGDMALVDRLYAEHHALHQFVTAECNQSAQDLYHFAELLAQHIRFEERELFEVAQNKLTPDVLNLVAEASSRMRNII